MKPIDKNYLTLQFRNKIYTKNGSEFQSFFEAIMEKKFPDFQKIRPHGSRGDKGNDGYRKNSGIYYQVYSPNTPKVKEKDAVKKLNEDFQKLKKEWDEISKIKEYNFVFNDKYDGSFLLLEQTLTDLNDENKRISFKLLLAKDLENIFFKLNDSDILNLGFNIDHRQAISNAYAYLEKVETELDRENAIFAHKFLENSKEIIFKLNDENLSLEYEILECRCLHKLEDKEKAIKKYERITKRFPDDPRAFLYLAEIYLSVNNYKKNKELIEKAKKIDNNHWLIKLEELVRKLHLNETIDIAKINENNFPENQRIKATYYRIYAQFYEVSKDRTNADKFIEKAIQLNPDRLSNYITKLTFMENRLFPNQVTPKLIEQSQKLLEEIVKVEAAFSEYGDIGARNKVILNLKKLNVLRLQENFPEYERISKESFNLSIKCNFDKQMDQIFTALLSFVSLPDEDLIKLLEYLKKSKKQISAELSKVLIFQFMIKDDLFTIGMKFFEEVNNKTYFDFIEDIKNKNQDKTLKFLENEVEFAVTIASTLKNHPNLRRKIIENLPDDNHIQKERLLLLLNYDEENYDDAFEILKKIDLKNLSYLECKPILKIILEKEAWDFAIVILEKLIEKEKKKKNKFYLKFHLFICYNKLKKFNEVIEIGEQLLNQDSLDPILDSKNKEILLSNTIFACLERGKYDKNALKKSLELLEEYQLSQPSFEYKSEIAAEVYLRNDDPQKALNSIVEGVKIKKVLSKEEYANLYFRLAVKIGNQINLNLDSIDKVSENTFVKLKDQEQWFFIGNENELDAIKISDKNEKYSIFIHKKIGDKIIFENKYGSDSHEEILEKIFTIEKYILWQTVYNFQELSKDDLLNGVQSIKIPQKGESIDPQNLLNYFKDIDRRTKTFFEMYCKNTVPLAMLALMEGGLINAIGRIQKENKGYVNFSNGPVEELEMQKEVSKRVVDEEKYFFIDGTSAFFLSESGLFKKIYNYLPNLKVPQSVINLLADITGKFTYFPGQTDYMGYSQGRITISSIKEDERKQINANIIESIRLLESKPENIAVISSANKVASFSEQKIPDELSNACILAQKENLPVLTEDFLYLKMNELETKKKPPEYFSSIILFRILYEEGKISFDEYLDFFGYASSYRFRFLSLNQDDIEKAVFGDKKIKIFNPENIRKLNFPLTLSEEYGVPFKVAFTVIVRLLLKILFDNTYQPEILERIFIEIIESFPRGVMGKRSLGEMFLSVCIKEVKKNKSNFIYLPKNPFVQEKINKLGRLKEIYNAENKFWIQN